MKPSFKSYSITSFFLVGVYFAEVVVWAWISPSAEVSIDVFLPLVMLSKIAAYLYMMCIPVFWMSVSIYKQFCRFRDSLFVVRMAALIRVKMRRPA